jgi:hypothetical protein
MRNNIVNYISQHGYTHASIPMAEYPETRQPWLQIPVLYAPTFSLKPDPPACMNVPVRFANARSPWFHPLSPQRLQFCWLMLMLVLVLAPILHYWTRFDVPPRVYRPVLRSAARALHPHRSDAASQRMFCFSNLPSRPVPRFRCQAAVAG